MHEELAEGEIAGVACVVEEGRCCFVVASAEGEAPERLAVHAAHVLADKDRASTLPLDADEGDEGEEREDGEQDQQAQHDVCQALDGPA